MKGFDLNPTEIAELKQSHRLEHDKRKADKIKSVILLGTGWTLLQVSEALLLDEETLRSYVAKYREGNLQKLVRSIITGRFSILTEQEKAWLSNHVQSNLYSRSSDIRKALYQETGKQLSARSIRRLLTELCFSYKKTKLVPGKADSSKQQAFIEHYSQLKSELNDNDAIYFMDSAHPTHNAEPGYAWIKTGQEKTVNSNTGRARININGAIDIHRLHAVSTQCVTTNALSIITLLKKIDRTTRQKGTIHLVLDNAGYNHSHKLRDYVQNSRFMLHYLPPYSPNLNPIERLWKFMKGEVIKNQYYEKLVDFKKAITQFFQYFRRYRPRLASLLTDNFRVCQTQT